MKLKQLATGLGATVVIGVGGFFGYGVVYSGTKAITHPSAYIESFSLPAPKEGQEAFSYMLGQLFKAAPQEALFMRMDREFGKEGRESAQGKRAAMTAHAKAQKKAQDDAKYRADMQAMDEAFERGHNHLDALSDRLDAYNKR